MLDKTLAECYYMQAVRKGRREYIESERKLKEFEKKFLTFEIAWCII